MIWKLIQCVVIQFETVKLKIKHRHNVLLFAPSKAEQETTVLPTVYTKAMHL